MERAGLTAISDLKIALSRVGGEPIVTTATAPPVATGWPAVDALLGGGLPRGRVAEIVGAPSSGKATLALAAAAGATAAGQLVAWVDARRELYPPSAAALGVELERLLVVRCPPEPAAVARAGEIVARSRAFALIVLDLPDGLRFSDGVATRLRAAAHDAGVAICALATARGAVAHAALRLQVTTAPASPSLRRVTFLLDKGGAAPPGTRADVALGRAVLGAFRDPADEAILREAAEAVTPAPPRRARRS